MAQRTPSSDLAVCVAHESFSRSRKASKSTSSLPSLARSARGAPSGAARLRRDVAAAVTPRPATAIGTAAKPSTNPTMSSTRAVWHRTPITPVHVGRGARCQKQDQMRPNNMHMRRAVTAVTGNLRDPAQEAPIRPPHLLRFALPRPVCPLRLSQGLGCCKVWESGTAAESWTMEFLFFIMLTSVSSSRWRRP